MDSSQFDRIARSFGAAASRRTALRGLAAGLLGAVGLGSSLDAIEARRRRRRRGDDRNRRCGAQYDGCNDERDCCEGLVCIRLSNPNAEQKFEGTCGYKRGCGKKNDYCRRNHECCRSFRCRGKRCKRRD
jgi:hypothetical protein